MKANQGAKAMRASGQPDGGQMLLLAGFILAGAVIIAVGTYSVLERNRGRVIQAQHEPMVDLFLNTRDRAIQFFDTVSEFDTPGSVENNLEGYLVGQHATARNLALELNATLAGSNSPAPTEDEEAARVDGGTGKYAGLTSHDGNHDYSCVDDDGVDDGLITDGDGTVYAAILYLRVLAPNGDITETLVIDVAATDPGC
ncbi:MAG: hypothetical protein R3185_04130 [Candidatus Thermoplasmatota archaeon]|nr:hypothetical protein [Candidatus Thermoplasmatota archaeon]